MEIRLDPRARALPGLVEAFTKHDTSRGDMVMEVKLIGLRRHLPQTLVVRILKGRDEGAGDDAVVPA